MYKHIDDYFNQNLYANRYNVEQDGGKTPPTVQCKISFVLPTAHLLLYSVGGYVCPRLLTTHH
jgi:hypothetical protein